MELKCRLKRGLTNARKLTDNLLSTFKTPEQWTHQVHPRANHPLWIAGHLGQADDFFISVAAPDRVRRMEAWSSQFGMGSQPTADASAYPPPADVLAYLADRRATLLDVLDKLPEEELARPTTGKVADFMPDIGSVFETAIWHEGMHAGQLTLAHRALGNPPLLGG